MTKFCFLLLFLLAGPTASAAELGRLFFDAKERQTLEEIRERALRPVGEASRIASFEGSVRRNDGVNTVWVDGKPMRANDAQTNKTIELSRSSTLRLLIQQGSGEKEAPLAASSPAQPMSKERRSASATK